MKIILYIKNFQILKYNIIIFLLINKLYNNKKKIIDSNINLQTH